MPTWMMALLGLLAYKAIKGGGLGNMMGGGDRQTRPNRIPARPAAVLVTFSAECSAVARVPARRRAVGLAMCWAECSAAAMRAQALAAADWAASLVVCSAARRLAACSTAG